jgi:Tfp pilus assembly protein PilO
VTATRSRFDIRQHGRPILFVLGGLLALNLAGFLLVVRPQVREFRALTTENSPRAQLLRARQDHVEALEAFVDALGQARTDLQTLREQVLSTRERRMVAVQAELRDLCERFNIDLELVNYEHGELGAEALEYQRMVVPLRGGYSALRGFLQAVESSDKFLVVEKVVLGQGKEGGVLLDLQITLATYFDSPELRRLRETAPRTARRKA